jgi:hypothetical protein
MTRLEHLKVTADDSYPPFPQIQESSPDKLMATLENLFDSLQHLRVVDIRIPKEPAFHRYRRAKLQKPRLENRRLSDDHWVLVC